MPRKPGSPKRLPTTLPTGTRNLAAYDKAVKCLQLRRDGMTWRDIATEVGFKSPASAHEAVQRLLKRAVQETDTEMRQIEAERLDAYQQKLNELIFDEGASPRMAARNAEVAIKVMERRARLFGLDAADKVQIENTQPTVIHYYRDSSQEDHRRKAQAIIDGDWESLGELDPELAAIGAGGDDGEEDRAVRPADPGPGE